MRHRRYEQFDKTMEALGVGEVSKDDFDRAAASVEATESGGRTGRLRHWSPGVRRALIVVCVFFVFQQITGINVPLYYGPHLLGPIFAGAHASLVRTTVAGVEVTRLRVTEPGHGPSDLLFNKPGVGLRPVPALAEDQNVDQVATRKRSTSRRRCRRNRGGRELPV